MNSLRPVAGCACCADLLNASFSRRRFLQTAAGVPLQCDEGSDFMTFRIGLFGLEKLLNVDRTVDLLEGALEQVMPQALAQTA
jgi:aspartate aminotransferase-like enzyme